MARSIALQQFIDAAFVAYDRFAVDRRSREPLQRMASMLQTPAREREGQGLRLPVCAILDEALDHDMGQAELTDLVAKFRPIESRLIWDLKERPDTSASTNFAQGHANGMILGPGGIEERNDVWLGVTLMAPDVRYPDHGHPPEEIYLALSPGEFRQGGGHWFSPGVGGSFYNVPGIKHAMRSTDRPFFAFWALPLI
ncbi:hypothetical protein PMI07_006123 [Rhizobium sp. CF080]|uniref:dimethylsulfonioproprionate lyase family protein n=1 Tax=Rhizobium sp. (strain CF080) TaxID=1144310 RepID=UPI0002719199|nr:dimethylsulfonioproprionate lyase family protein [Rhizobium sp. CF080]EUB99842.1 hypothetical protein PMI07_006123 [Rhizobium sp. CF080]